jgi:cystathionine beta-lyase
MYDFDKVIDRRGTCSVKYDSLKEVFGTEDLLPMWVADMDFQAPPSVLEAVRDTAQRGVFGYTFRSVESVDSYIDWVGTRYDWKIRREWVTSAPGIVAALPIAIRAFTDEGDKILIQTPVYPPFHAIVQENNRTLVKSPLINTSASWEIDWEDFENRLAGGVKMFILCSSHNPLGRVWSREELMKMGELCCKYNTIIFSDEIHADLSLYGNKHTVMASVSDEIADNTITAMAPSKTFNIAGMLNSVIVSSSERLLESYNGELKKMHLDLGNIFGHISMAAAYCRKNEEWLRALTSYLEKNIDFAYDFVGRELSGVTFIKPQSSFLLWLDFRNSGYSHQEVKERLLNVSKLGLNDGLAFGPEGEGFFRMNLGTTLSRVREGMERLKTGFSKSK